MTSELDIEPLEFTPEEVEFFEQIQYSKRSQLHEVLGHWMIRPADWNPGEIQYRMCEEEGCEYHDTAHANQDDGKGQNFCGRKEE